MLYLLPINAINLSQIIFHNHVAFFFQKHEAKMEPWDNLILLSYHRCHGNRGLLLLLSETKVKTGKKKKNREPRQKEKKKNRLDSFRDVEMFLFSLWDYSFKSTDKLESFLRACKWSPK